MEPPSLQLYDSKSALITSAKDFAAAHGYALVIKRSKETKVWLKCDRGEAYRNQYKLDENHRIRSTGSRLIDSPMMLLGTFKWSLEAWELSVAESNHNHEASHRISAHPSFRKLNTTQSQDLEVMTNAEQPPRVIRSVIQQSDPQLFLRLSDIYNARAKYRLAKLAGRTSIQAFLRI